MLPISDYAAKKKDTNGRIIFKMRKKPHFKVVVAGEIQNFPYDYPSQISAESIIASVRARFQLPAVNHYICNVDGIISF